jgi:hypothetical protein
MQYPGSVAPAGRSAIEMASESDFDLGQYHRLITDAREGGVGGRVCLASGDEDLG